MEGFDRITKDQLLGEITDAWKDLKGFLDTLSDEQMTALTDLHGWSVKDHLSHLAAWENSINFFLQDKTRYKGLGIDKNLFETGSIDEMNQVIQKHHRKMGIREVLNLLDATHSDFLQLIASKSDDDLNQPLKAIQPETSEGGQYPVVKIIFDNTADHFKEHLAWIKTLILSGLERGI
jgi:hypothetical protein